jgi:hypothetical protein
MQSTASNKLIFARFMKTSARYYCQIYCHLSDFRNDTGQHMNRASSATPVDHGNNNNFDVASRETASKCLLSSRSTECDVADDVLLTWFLTSRHS